MTFSPKHDAVMNASVNLFSNDQLTSIPVSGTSGAVALVCESAPGKVIQLGKQKDSSLLWVDVFLKNSGSLPLNMVAVLGSNPSLLRLELVGVIPSVERHSRHVVTAPIVTRDYWRIVRRHLNQVLSLKEVNQSSGHKALLGDDAVHDQPSKRFVRAWRGSHTLLLPIHAHGHDIWSGKSLTNALPTLSPGFCYHLRLGYVCDYGQRSPMGLAFHYVPASLGDEKTESKMYCRSLELELQCTVYREPTIDRKLVDFGMVPLRLFADERTKSVDDAQRLGEESLGITRITPFFTSPDSIQLVLTNPSFDMAFVALDHVSMPWYLDETSWELAPGERRHITVHFRPEKQTQYLGSMQLKHTHGNLSVALSGTGARAEVHCDQAALDFGRQHINTSAVQPLTLRNVGLLGCTVQLLIEPAGAEFRFAEDKLHSFDAFQSASSEMTVSVECLSTCAEPTPTDLSVRWQVTPNGRWLEHHIPLTVSIGNPRFRLKRSEHDFETTFIGSKRTVAVEVHNDGNAACKWNANVQSNFVKLEPSNGVVGPQESATIRVTYAPEKFELFHTNVIFDTDAGEKVFVCYGVVGLPLLKVHHEDLNTAFGVLQIGKHQTKVIPLRNMGKRAITYKTALANTTKNGLSVELEDFPDMFVENGSGSIAPGGAAEIILHATPKEYKVTYSADLVITTLDDEFYTGSISCTGGQAILRFEKPKVSEGRGALVPFQPLSPVSDQRLFAVKLAIESLVASAAQSLVTLQVTEVDGMPIGRKPRPPKSFIIDEDSVMIQSISKSDLDTTNVSNEKLTELRDALMKVADTANEHLSRLGKALQQPSRAISENEDGSSILDKINSDVLPALQTTVDLLQELHNHDNSDTISVTLRIFTQEASTLQELVDPSKAEPSVENRHHRNFHMGLIRGGDQSPAFDLFTIVNTGNLLCSFQIRRRDDFSIAPDGAVPTIDAPLFSMRPMKGTVVPNEAVTVNSDFLGKLNGLYQQGYDFYCDQRAVLTFNVSAIVGNPKIEVDIKSLDFGLVLRNRQSVLQMNVRNNGSYADKFSIESVDGAPMDMVSTAVVGADGQANGAAFFSVGEVSADELKPGESTVVLITFAPRVNGSFTRQFRVTWSKEPILVKMSVRYWCVPHVYFI